MANRFRKFRQERYDFAARCAAQLLGEFPRRVDVNRHGRAFQGRAEQRNFARMIADRQPAD